MWLAFSSAQNMDTSHGKSSCCPRRQRILERRPTRIGQVVLGCDRFAATGNEHPKSQRSNRGNACRRIDRTRERSEEHTSELQSHSDLVCRLLLEKKKKNTA